MTKPDDIFYVVGYTNDQVSEGGISRLMKLSDHVMSALASLHHKFGALAQAAANGWVVEEPIEIYSVPRIDGNPYGDAYFEFVFLNDVALRMCRLKNVRVPTVLKKIMRSEIPGSVSALMRNTIYVPKGEEGVPPERLQSFHVGDYVRPRVKHDCMGTIVDVKWDGERFIYHFKQDPRFTTPNPPRDEFWRDDEFELWPRPADAAVEFINKAAKRI
jgi:hypothetical protein